MTCERIAMQQNMYFVETSQNQQLAINSFSGKWGKKSDALKSLRGGQKTNGVVLDEVGRKN